MMDHLSETEQSALKAAMDDIKVRVVPEQLLPGIHHRAKRIRIRRRIRITVAGLAAVAGCSVLMAETVGPAAPQSVKTLSPGPSPSTSASPTTATTPATSIPPAFPPQPSVTGESGYTPNQAAALVSECTALPGSGQTDPVLRAVARDQAGTVLVITTTSGWETCNVPNDGTPTSSGSQAFQTWAATDGWMGAGAPSPATATAPSEAPDYYLTEPIESFGASGGTVDGGWRNTLVGRAAPGIAKVTGILPGGATVTANVQNGMFILDDLTPASPAYGPEYNSDLRGYNQQGALVYEMPYHEASTDQPHCFVAPGGEAVTPSGGSSQCLTAVPWG